jgi:uncharacterized protein YecE (DUF72 family)
MEIHSTFYRIPNEFMVKNWAKRTLENFRFTAKFPKVITHDKQLVDVEDEVDLFLNNMEPIQEKTLALLIQLLIQLPPSMQIMHGLEGLRNLLPLLDDGFRYVVELRHQSWFQDLAYNLFMNNNLWYGVNLQELELPQLSHQISFMLDSLETEVLTKRTLEGFRSIEY